MAVLSIRTQRARWAPTPLLQTRPEAAGMAFTRYDARHTFVSTLMAAGVPVPEVAADSGHSVGELAAVAAGDRRLRSQTTLAV